MSSEELDRIRIRRERNRVAAARCRDRRRVLIDTLQNVSLNTHKFHNMIWVYSIISRDLGKCPDLSLSLSGDRSFGTSEDKIRGRDCCT